jgi:hypothetical protein
VGRCSPRFVLFVFLRRIEKLSVRHEDRGLLVKFLATTFSCNLEKKPPASPSDTDGKNSSHTRSRTAWEVGRRRHSSSPMRLRLGKQWALAAPPPASLVSAPRRFECSWARIRGRSPRRGSSCCCCGCRGSNGLSEAPGLLPATRRNQRRVRPRSVQRGCVGENCFSLRPRWPVKQMLQIIWPSAEPEAEKR